MAIELYTFGEVAKALGIKSVELNDIIMDGRLKPVRHQGRLKFKKHDVEKLKKSIQNKNLYSWDEVLRELQFDHDELKATVRNGELQVYEENGEYKFDKKEIQEFKQVQQFKDTVVVSSPPLHVIQEIEQLEVPSLDLMPGLPSLSHDSSLFEEKEEYYSREEVLNILQIEQSELEHLLNEGILAVLHTQGSIKFQKSAVEHLRHERMIDATMVVEPDIIEEEDIQPIIITANSTQIMPNQADNYYSFEEALYQLQVEARELKKMIAKQELEASKGPDGQLRFFKEDIDKFNNIIQPTVILPDEEDFSDDDETIPLPEEISPDPKTFSAAEKSFYDFSEAAWFLNVTKEQIDQWIQDGSLRAYRYQGKQQLRRVDIIKFKDKKASSETSKPVKKKLSPKKHVPLFMDTGTYQAEKNPSEYYDMEEVKKILGIEETQVKVMVARGQISVIRGGSGYLFLRDSVNALAKKSKPRIKPQSRTRKVEVEISQANDEVYNLDQVQEILSIGKNDIERLIQDKLLKKLAGNYFLKREVDKLKREDNVEVTMVLPLSGVLDDDDDDDEMPMLAIPKKAPRKPQKSFTNKAVSARTMEELKRMYYTWDQALMELQMEDEELMQAVQEGGLEYVVQDGKKFIKRASLELLKKDKMIEPTIMVDEESDDILEEDDDDIFFLR